MNLEITKIGIKNCLGKIGDRKFCAYHYTLSQQTLDKEQILVQLKILLNFL